MIFKQELDTPYHLNLKYRNEKPKKILCPYGLGHLPGIAAVDLLGRHVDGDNFDVVVGRVEGHRTCRALCALCAPCAPLRTCDLQMRRFTFL